MGLDMYLECDIQAPKFSPLFKVIDDNLDPEHREHLESPGLGEYAYVSGWTFGEKKPDPLYEALVVETGFTPHAGSPHFDLYQQGDGYRVVPLVFYWRKANQIHAWFVENVQHDTDDCGRYSVHPEMLADLVERCEKVTVDHDLAAELLPPQGGFFFGSTEFDEWYYQDLKETAVHLKGQVDMLPRGVPLFYQSSW